MEHTSTRDSHAAALAALRDLSTASLSELAHHTGLSRPTLASALDSLAPGGLVTVGAGSLPAGDRGGRPARIHAFDAGGALVASVDLSQSFASLALADRTGAVVARSRSSRRSPTTQDPDLTVVAELLDETLAVAGRERRDVCAVTCGVTGLVDNGVVFRSPSVRQWRNVDLVAELRALLDLPVHVENDLVLAAEGETRSGALRDAACGVYVLTWHHVSSRITVDGRVLRGRSNQAGEMGLLRTFLDPTRQPGDLLDEVAATDRDLARLTTDPADEVGLATLMSLTEAMAPAVAALLLAVDPDTIVLGGPLGRHSAVVGPQLSERIRAVSAGRDTGTPIVGSALGGDAVLMGGLIASFERFSHVVYGLPGLRSPHIVLSEGSLTP